MVIDLLHLFLAVALSAFLYPFWIRFVYSFQMGERVRSDGPKSHLKKRGTPTMGGLVFIFTTAIITFLFNRSRTQTLFPLFVASLAGLFGLVEDFTKVFKNSAFFDMLISFRRWSRGLFKKSSKVPGKLFNSFREFWRVMGSREERGFQTYEKFLFQFSIAGFTAYWTYFKLGWDYIWFPLVGNVHLGFLYPIFIVILFIVILNSVAFTDGLDGLAGGLSLFAFCGYWLIAQALGYNSLASFCATFVGALIPFLYFNIFPARVFMGNVGSHVLGATLAMLGIVMHREAALFLLVLVFLADGISSPLQSLSVKITKKRLFRMAPLHHHFEVLGWPETKVTMRFWLFGIFFTFLGIFVALL
ncbi:hypothetical protein GF360_02610 [candidate division WWE3 bacterium]|nr:hypothetical protein [candidate division WWE3 bacterium]